MRMLLALAGLMVLIWLGWAVLMFAGQRGLVFPGAGLAAPTPPLPPGAGNVVIDGAKQPGQAILLRASTDAPAPALLFAHGNFEYARQNVAAFEPWADAGIHVLLVEYPGYDGAPGSPSQASLDALWLAAYDWLVRQPGVDARRIVSMGRSLGSGPTSALAARRPLAAVVLQSAFATTDRFAHDRLLPGFLVRDRWDNVAALRQFGGPVFASHGRGDVVIPPSHGQALAALPKVRMDWLDCGHDDCPFLGPDYRNRVLAFFRDTGVLVP